MSTLVTVLVVVWLLCHHSHDYFYYYRRHPRGRRNQTVERVHVGTYAGVQVATCTSLQIKVSKCGVRERMLGVGEWWCAQTTQNTTCCLSGVMLFCPRWVHEKTPRESQKKKWDLRPSREPPSPGPPSHRRGHPSAALFTRRSTSLAGPQFEFPQATFKISRRSSSTVFFRFQEHHPQAMQQHKSTRWRLEASCTNRYQVALRKAKRVLS